MGRWQPGANTRLREAAFELFAQHGFANVTVEQIAEAAGVTQRTFFRHFPTKEEVFFSDGALIVAELLEAIRGAPPEATPSQLLVVALIKLAESFEPNRSALRLRAHVIDSETALRERELLKQHGIAMTLVGDFVQRGMSKHRAAALVGTGMAVFQVAYAAWVTDKSRASLSSRIQTAISELAADLSTDEV